MFQLEVLGPTLQPCEEVTAIPVRSGSRSPSKRASTSPVKRSSMSSRTLLPIEEMDGLHFLLQACELLETEGTTTSSGKRTFSKRSFDEYSGSDRESSLDATGSPSRRRRVKSLYDSDEEYKPARRPSRRAGATGVRVAAQLAAATAAAVESGDMIGSMAAPIAAAPRPKAPERTPKEAAVGGPCMNPNCEHPHDSPQWRKGPPEAPVLCNACGTRFLRNGSLVPICPRRGIRYGKDGKPIRMITAVTKYTRRNNNRRGAVFHEEVDSDNNTDISEQEILAMKNAALPITSHDMAATQSQNATVSIVNAGQLGMLPPYLLNSMSLATNPVALQQVQWLAAAFAHQQWHAHVVADASKAPSPPGTLNITAFAGPSPPPPGP